MNAKPVWIDCDPGVDDAVALFLADRLPQLEIVGISTVAGNAALPTVTRNALQLCELMGKSYPVYRGAKKPLLREYNAAESFHGADGLGGAVLPEPTLTARAESAWDALYAAAKRHEGALELIVLGPMSNVATAFAKYPALPRLLRRVLFMGGSATHGNCTPCAEFNVYSDPEAAQLVLCSSVPKVMCGLEVTEQAYVTPQELASLCAGENALCRFLRSATGMLLKKNLDAGLNGWCIHDACPVLYCASPALFSGREAGVYVETQATVTLGKTVTDLYSDKKFDRKNAFAVLDIDREAFVATLFHTATSL